MAETLHLQLETLNIVDDENVNDTLVGDVVVGDVVVNGDDSNGDEIIEESNPLLETVIALSQDLKNIDLNLVKGSVRKIWLREGMNNTEKEKHIVLQCRQKEYAHYDWSLLAGRLQIHFHRKNVPTSFSESTKAMKEILHPWYYNFVMENADYLNSLIIEERDMTFDIFAADTLISSYLARIIIDGRTWVCETPQYMYLRVAVFLWFQFTGVGVPSSSSEIRGKCTILKGQGNNEQIKLVYNDLSNGSYSHASPTLFNAGMLKHQLASCFTKTIGDSIKSIADSWKDVAYISKDSGGLGLDFSELRHSEISRNGKTNGVIPWIRIVESILTTVNQCFTPDTIVYTINRGPIEINKVMPGDTLLRADGGIGTVAEQIRHKITDLNEGESGMYSVSIATYPEDVYVTGNHPVYALKYPAVVETMEDVTTHIDNGTVIHTYIPVNQLDEYSYIATPVPSYQRDMEHYTLDDCRFYGLMLGRVHRHLDVEKMKSAAAHSSHSRSIGKDSYSVSELDLVLNSKTNSDDIAFVAEYLENYGIDFTQLRNTHNNTTTFSWDTFHRNFKFTKKMVLAHGYEAYFHHAFLHLPPQKISQIYYAFLSGKSLVAIEIPQTIYDSIRYIQIRLGIVPFSRSVIYPDSSTIYKTKSQNQLHSFFYNGMLWSRVENVKCGIEDIDAYEYIVDLEMESVKGLSEDVYANYVTCLGTVHNGGRRKGSGTGFLCDWHLDIEDYIALKNPENPEDLRALGMTFAVNIHDLFMERCEKDEDWTLFCPNKTNGLVNKWGPQFEASYLELEQKAREGKIPASKVVKARELLFKMLLSSLRTASPFVLYIDAGNRKSNQQHLGTTRLSNLCMEILLYSDANNIGSCNLAAVNLSKCISQEHSTKQKFFDYEELERLTRALTRNINQVIDRNFYHKQVPQIEYTNMRNRPEGLGYMGLADVIAMLDLTWDSEEVRLINVMISETMYYAAVSESCKLAQEFGYYETFPGSPTSQGLLQPDLWKKEAIEKELANLEGATVDNVVGVINKYKDESTFDYLRFGSKRYNWEQLREDVKRHGLRNSLLIALMPTATSAHILGTNESFEPYTQHIFTRTILAGQYVVTNKHLVNDLQELGLWNTAVARNIWENEGSVQQIPEFFYLTEAAKERLRYLKLKYLTVYELPQQLLQNLCIDRASYVCQTQSFNCWMKEATVSKLVSYFFHGWKNGLKTGIYYLRQPAKKNPVNHALKNIKVMNNRSLVKEEYVCTSCSV
jgi:ribonucleoside-diphosphate reductase alpha subunit